MTSFQPQQFNEQNSKISYQRIGKKHGMIETIASFNENHQIIRVESEDKVIENVFDDLNRLVEQSALDYQVRHLYDNEHRCCAKTIKKDRYTVSYQYVYDALGREISRIGSDQSKRHVKYFDDFKLVAYCNAHHVWQYRKETLDGYVLEVQYP